MTVVRVQGKRAIVIKYPTTSSMTILGLSLVAKMISARSEAHQAKEKAAAELNR